MTIITLIMFTLSLFEPHWFLSEETIDKFSKRPDNSTDVLCYIPGFLFSILYLFYLLQSLSNNFSKKDWILVAAILGMFFIYQNRSTLIYLAVIMLYFMIKNRAEFGKRGRIVILLSILIVMVFGFQYVRTVTNALIGETQEQLDDDDYARKVAFQYYVFDYNKGSIIRALFGNGQPTKGSEYIEEMNEGHEMGAHWSDLGFIGDWFLFGILPIIALLIMMFKVFRYPFPQYLKYLFASFLMMPTIHSFAGNNMEAFYFSLVIYFVCLNEYEITLMNESSEYTPVVNHIV